MASSDAGENPISEFIEVQKALKGATYPASKADLVKFAIGNGAGKEILDALNALPEQDFGSPADVSKGIGSE